MRIHAGTRGVFPGLLLTWVCSRFLTAPIPTPRRSILELLEGGERTQVVIRRGYESTMLTRVRCQTTTTSCVSNSTSRRLRHKRRGSIVAKVPRVNLLVGSHPVPYGSCFCSATKRAHWGCRAVSNRKLKGSHFKAASRPLHSGIQDICVEFNPHHTHVISL